jgi:2-polyprenyl-6-methoxyphenol hydroxylase-like FAD-dependent oxidoreductase
MNTLKEYHSTGGVVHELDVSGTNQMWQHPWHLVHRVSLHDKLKKVATSSVGVNPAATLQTAAKVVEVDAEAGKVIFADGTTEEADVVVGADGIYVSLDQIQFISGHMTDIQIVKNQKGH